MQNSGIRGSKWGHARQRVILALSAGALLLAGAVAVAPDGGSTASKATVVAGPAAAEAARFSGSASSDRSARRWPPTTRSVGVPDGTVLSKYKGRCNVKRAGKVIDAKIINCSPLRIKTTGVVIKNSKINGAVLVGTQDDFDPIVISDPEGDDPIRVTVLRSEIDVSAGTNPDFRPISSSHYIVKRSYLHGTYSGAECHNACTIKWSYVHGFGSHASGLRILRNGTLKNNTIWCEPNPNSDDDGDGVPDVDGGCSGNLTMYEEFGTPHNNLVKHNYFPAGWFWYSLKFNGKDDGHIRIVDNLFGRPKSGGRHVADDWDPKPTNVWSGNTFPNGRVAKP
jgi:hypothetical protein